jgi:hypothetical protein
MKFWEQLLLQLISPVVGTALIGTLAALITRRYQDQRLDRQVRLDLVSSMSEVACAIHTELAFYERWVRHSRPSARDRDKRRAEVDREFIEQRIKLGAIQTEVDAYFGQASAPGILLHRLTDLTMLRYAFILDLPRSQVAEIIDHLGQPGHSGYSIEELEVFSNTPKPSGAQIWAPTAAIEKSFMMALHDTIHKLLATRPITTVDGFKSGRLLTAYDQRD